MSADVCTEPAKSGAGRPKWFRYQPGTKIGVWTLKRHYGHGRWDIVCICGTIRRAKGVDVRQNPDGCKQCYLTARQWAAPPRAPEPPPIRRDPCRPQISDVRRAVCATFGLGLKDIVFNDKFRSPNRLALPRQLAMTLARDLTDLSYTKIGQYFGARDHSTCMYAVRRVRERIATDPTWAQHYESIRLQLDVRAQIEIEAEA